MKHKIIQIENNKHCKEVGLFLHRDNDGYNKVVIQAWHEDLIQVDYLTFEDCADEMQSAENFIRDFSKVSAIDFVESFNYQPEED